jgi:hypothetical protein
MPGFATEREFASALYSTSRSHPGLAYQLGWRLTYRTLRSKGSNPGFPDNVLARERVIFAELKVGKNKPTRAQREWLSGLAAARAEVYLWYPSDLDEIGRILAFRATPEVPTPARAWELYREYGYPPAEPVWSAWLPGPPTDRNDGAREDWLAQRYA